MGEQNIYLSNIKRSVLVVDDEFINREILGGILEDSYEVLYAEDGEKALQVIEEQGPLLSLVLLDLRMPNMDGFEVMKQMQQDVVFKNIPIIVLTSDESAEIESLKMGAADFIKKPYDMPEKIMARVKRIIALYEDRMIIQSTEKDELTGLLSKSYFFEYASLQDRFHPNRSMDALTVNVSHFHLYNELYGVQEGNEVLKIIAKEIEKFANAHEGIACRSEGDNFYLYVAHQAGYEGFVNDVIAAITGDTTVHNTQIRIGINSEVDKSESLEMSFERARMAGDSIRESQKEKIAFF